MYYAVAVCHVVRYAPAYIAVLNTDIAKLRRPCSTELQITDTNSSEEFCAEEPFYLSTNASSLSMV